MPAATARREAPPGRSPSRPRTSAPPVTELEILDGETILGETENLTDGLSGSFTLTLEQGEYTLYCPGGTTSAAR